MKNKIQCEWKAEDCKFAGTDKCNTCFVYRQNYKPSISVQLSGFSKKQAKIGNRQGSEFEFKNHCSNTEILQDKVISGMTLNSGATVLEKGDEQIRGIISVMEELKTKTSQSSSGQKNFTIKKEWLEKLHKEAVAEDKEFWYLKFNFFESDKDVYVVVEQDIIMAMIKTMVEDRKSVIRKNKQMSAVKSKCEYLEQEILSLKAKLNYYEKSNSLKSEEDIFEIENSSII